MDIANFKELFNCPSCDRLFNTDIRCPKILSCGHSFCLTCLDKLFPSTPQCPTCKLAIQFTSVDLIPVNFLIESCISKINIKSGINENDSTEFKDIQDNDNLNPSILSPTHLGLSSKRRKLMCEGFCDEHENYKELRCMNCEIWICSMCAALHHKQCNTLLVEEAYKEIKETNSKIIEKELHISKLRVSRVSESIKIIEEKKILLKQEIENLQLKIEVKLNDLQDQEFQFKELHEWKVKENNFSCKINEIQVLNNNCSCNKELLALKTKLDTLIKDSNRQIEPQCSASSLEIQFDECNEIKEEFFESTIENEIEELDRFKPDSVSTESYLPDTFTNLALKLLNGDTMSNRDQVKAKNRLVKEIMFHLNEKGLLTSNNPHSNKHGYSLLGDQLLKTYKSFTWYSNGPENSHPCQGLISQLSNRRRQQKYRSRKLQHASMFSPIQSLEKLESFLSDDFCSVNIKKLLTDSFPLRSGPVEKLPSYLFLSKEAMLCEIGLRMNKNANTLLVKLINLEKKFQVFSQNPYARICDVEEYFRTASSTDRFLTICNENIESPTAKKDGPCIILNEVDAILHLYDSHEEKFVLLKGSFNLFEACLVGFGAYFILNLPYPKDFAQFLLLLEICLKSSRKQFPSSFRGKKLKSLLEFL